MIAQRSLHLVATATLATATLAAIARAHEPAALEVPTSHAFGRAAAIEHRIYYFGGGSSDVDVLDAPERKWSRIASGVKSSLVLGDQIDGNLYLIDTASRKFVRVDPNTERVEKLPDVPTRRTNGAAIAAAGKLYVIGGYTDDVTARNCVEVFDPKTNRWTVGPPLPGYRSRDHFHAAAVLDGKLHVVGGLLDGNRDQPHWRLDGDRWTRRADPPLHAMWKHAALAAAGGKLYLIAPHPISPQNQGIKTEHNVHAYDAATDKWQPVGPTPKRMPIGLFAQAVVGEKIYILGGVGSNAVYVFDTKTAAWE